MLGIKSGAKFIDPRLKRIVQVSLESIMLSLSFNVQECQILLRERNTNIYACEYNRPFSQRDRTIKYINGRYSEFTNVRRILNDSRSVLMDKYYRE